MVKQLARVTLALVCAVGLADAAQAQSFDDLSYESPVNPSYTEGAPTHACHWGGQAVSANYNGGNWSGFAALDLRDYLFSGGQTTWGRCFREGRTWYHYVGVDAEQSLTGYQQQYASYDPDRTNVVAMGSEEAAFSYANPFTLKNMKVGAGWGNVQSLRVTGWLDGSEVWNRTFSLLGTGGAFEMFGAAGSINEVRFFATYATGENADPYNTVGEQLGYGMADASVYRTFFIDDIETVAVPEPGTFGLVAAGLAGLVALARRRQSVK